MQAAMLDNREGDIRRVSAGPHVCSDLLEQTRWLADFQWPQIETLAKYLHLYEADGGTELISEGSKESFLAIIVEGKVRVEKDDAGQARKQIGLLGPGKAFGEMSLIDGSPRSAAIVAVGTVRFLVLAADDFARLKEDVPALAILLLERIASLISARLRHTSGKLVDFLQD